MADKPASSIIENLANKGGIMPLVNVNSRKYPKDRTMQPGNSTVKPGQPVPWQQSVWNGRYQQISWLGVNGWIIVNHHDREILLIDPWPTYDQTSAAGIGRLKKLANFIRRGNALKQPYKLVGTLISHQHFDHTNDVVLLYRMLSATSSFKVEGTVECRPTGKAIPYSELPPICCDYDSRNHLCGQFDASKNKQLSQTFGRVYCDKWIEVVGRNNETLHYRDEYNKRQDKPLKAGLLCKSFDLGHFHIQPFVWDHYSIMNLDAGWFGAAGNLQRQTAFHIWHRDAPSPKKTFVSGSAGEMSKKYTESVRWYTNPKIKTDMLIQSINDRESHMKHLLKYQQKCFQIRGHIVCSHWESFFTGPASRKKFKEDFFEAVVPYIQSMKKTAAGKKVMVLGRRGFEFKYPLNPARMALDDGDKVKE